MTGSEKRAGEPHVGEAAGGPHVEEAAGGPRVEESVDGAHVEQSVGSAQEERERRSLTDRLRQYWQKHRRLFWTLHSVWALGTGVVVVVLARERYGFVPWVVLFLILTWASTLFFGGRVRDDEEDGVPAAREEAAAYAMRTLYQETLFFLLPFYAYSTVLKSWNVGFLALLGLLAIVSCLDLVFDRLLRTRPTFGFVFFATISFAAINLLLPIMLPVNPSVALGIAAVVAVVTSLPLALRNGFTTWRERAALGLLSAGMIITPLVAPVLVPPVPLRLDSAVFTSFLERDVLEPADDLGEQASVASLDGALYVLVEVFAPSSLPARVALQWTFDGEPLRQSREVAITAHGLGFRVWDAWRPESGSVEPGLYSVAIRTSDGRVFGSSEIELR